MKVNLKLFFEHMYHSLFKSNGTPGRLSPKRFLFVIFVLFAYPIWVISLRTAYLLDIIFYPEYMQQEIEQPIFIVGNYRSGTTFLHRLLLKDKQFTSFKAYEIYVTPSIVQRRLLQWILWLNSFIGNPIRKVVDALENYTGKFAHIHNIRLNEAEEDDQLLFHIWSTYSLLAFFPFPKLIKRYIYYDDKASDKDKARDMTYYHDVLKRHIYASGGKRLISKNPPQSSKVRTLHQRFPDAKFINIVRNPLQVIPSSISLFSAHWQTYGNPETEYALQDTMIEQGKYWYFYPHQYLKRLPSDQYMIIRYRDLVADPKKTIENIYQRFGIQLSREYTNSLLCEAEKAKEFKSKHKYSLKAMGLNRGRIAKEFSAADHQYHFDLKEQLLNADKSS